jgi:hypothetical protein
MQDCDKAERHRIATGEFLSGRKTGEHGGRGQHGLRMALPSYLDEIAPSH